MLSIISTTMESEDVHGSNDVTDTGEKTDFSYSKLKCQPKNANNVRKSSH